MESSRRLTPQARRIRSDILLQSSQKATDDAVQATTQPSRSRYRRRWNSFASETHYLARQIQVCHKNSKEKLIDSVRVLRHHCSMAKAPQFAAFLASGTRQLECSENKLGGSTIRRTWLCESGQKPEGIKSLILSLYFLFHLVTKCITYRANSD